MKTPEEIADEIVNVASDPPRTNGDGGCPSGHMDEDIDRVCSACLRSMIAAAIREAEIRGASWGIDAARAAHNAAKGACESRDCCEGITTIALRSLDPAAISAERSAGTSPNDRLVTPKLAVAARAAGTVPPAPIHVAAPAVKQQLRQAVESPLLRCAPDVVAFQASITDEQIERMEARSRELPDEPEDEEPPKPAPACARCGGSGYLCPVCSRSECFQGDPCPECRGKP